jgi:copper chaperone
MANQLTLNISGMHCDACVRRVTAALEKVPGIVVEDVKVGTARLRIPDGQADTEAIHAAVRKTGFEVESEEAS